MNQFFPMNKGVSDQGYGYVIIYVELDIFNGVTAWAGAVLLEYALCFVVLTGFGSVGSNAKDLLAGFCPCMQLVL